MKYSVKDIKLAPQGQKNITWAENQMGALIEVQQEFKKTKPLKNIAIGMALHVTKETAVLVRTLKHAGAQVAIASCNPLSSQDDVAAALAKEGVAVFAHKGESKKEYYQNIKSVINFMKDMAQKKMKLITIDDGCDLVFEIHTRHRELLKYIIGGAEETTTGIIRLKSMEKEKALQYPVIAVNDSKTKHLMDNYIGTGQSTIDGILRATNTLFAGKVVVIIGFGNCGKGVARRASGLGANVIVTEVDPFCALQAIMEGYRVMPLNQAAKIGDIFITLTGNIHVIDAPHMKIMKDGAILANSGHFDVEINVNGLEKISNRKEFIRPYLDKYTTGKKSLYLVAQGRLCNLAAAEGHPSTIMAMSFCNQFFACKYLVDNQNKLENKVYLLPDEFDEKISKLQLKALDIKIDKLTQEQIKYLNSWQQGT